MTNEKEKLQHLRDEKESLEEKLSEANSEIVALQEERFDYEFPKETMWDEQKLDWLKEHFNEFTLEDLEGMLELKTIDV